MTRWARSGSTQQHKKMPGEGTPWSEFSHESQESPPKNLKKRKSSDHQKASNNLQGPSDISINKSPRKKSHCGEVNLKPKIEVEMKSETSVSGIKVEIKNISELQALPTKKNKKKKKLAKSHNIKNDSDQSDKGGNNLITEESDSPVKTSQNKSFEKKKNWYMAKLKKRRAENGIILLPAKVERKLYIIKKKLREKGVSVEKLKEIIRKERRKEELKFRKTFNPFKPCFNCRKPGHIYADCPEKSNSVKQTTGICFKCGSEEHTSYKCPSAIQGYPFAKCFVCKEQGHITRDCPKNKHGIYPKGGGCGFCGNVNHMKKDCPSLRKKKEKEEPSFTLHTINEAKSMDAEITGQRSATKKKYVQKPKVVKF